jgi:hypothetical protein
MLAVTLFLEMKFYFIVIFDVVGFMGAGVTVEEQGVVVRW